MDTTSNTNYVVTSLTAGINYEFKVEARNIYGYSEYSETITLLCAYIPTVPTNVITSIEATLIKIQWTLGSENGSPITKYQVFIRESDDSTYTLENVDCDGTQQSIIDNRYCHVQITTLEAAPYNLIGGDSIYAKVIAENYYG